ncbi:hypothetical protein N9B82_00205 [Saprospiraceae bacterium]|nr:hypothetical protein [Saprospiraceae bacterium]
MAALIVIYLVVAPIHLSGLFIRLILIATAKKSDYADKYKERIFNYTKMVICYVFFYHLGMESLKDQFLTQNLAILYLLLPIFIGIYYWNTIKHDYFRKEIPSEFEEVLQLEELNEFDSKQCLYVERES